MINLAEGGQPFTAHVAHGMLVGLRTNLMWLYYLRLLIMCPVLRFQAAHSLTKPSSLNAMVGFMFFSIALNML